MADEFKFFSDFTQYLHDNCESVDVHENEIVCKVDTTNVRHMILLHNQKKFGWFLDGISITTNNKVFFSFKKKIME